MNNIFYLLKNCPDDYAVLEIFKILLAIFKVLCIIIPIALIIITIIDLTKKIIANGKDDDIGKLISMFLKRFISGLIVFFIPTIVLSIFNYFGNIGVSYVNYIACANNEDIVNVKTNIILELLDNARNNLDFDSYAEANRLAREINNQDLINQTREVKEYLDSMKPTQTSEEISGETPEETSTGTSKENLEVNYSDAVINNLAYFIASESGAYKAGFEGQLLTGAVFINQLYGDIVHEPYASIIEKVNLNNMCDTFKFGASYSEGYCYFDYSKFVERRGNLTDAQKNQVITVAKIILAKEFTIPKEIIGQGNLSNWTGVGIEWGTTTTHEGCVIDKYHDTGCAQVFAYSKYYPLTGKDVYGRNVSTNFNDYKKKADDLYKKYIGN